tara:strand:- start:973 stop:1404 length:432 start_codon:yes stop_codon:yes gene_type:complete
MFGHLNHGKPELGSVTITTGAGAEIIEYTAKATITAGQVVQWDTSMPAGKLGVERSTDVIVGTATNLAVGVALESAVSGETVRVCVGGYIENVACASGVALGELLMPVASGEVKTQTGAFQAVAIALENLADNTVDLYWFRRV